MKTLPPLVCCLLLLMISYSAAQDDWRIAAFEKYQRMEIEWEIRESEIMQGFEPRLAEYYALDLPFKDAVRKMDRYSFIKRLNQHPESIDWSHFLKWSSGTDSTDDERKLSRIDHEYRRLRDSMLEFKEALREAKELSRLRNTVYRRHCNEIDKEVDLLMKNIQLLQEDINRRMASKGIGSDTAKDAAPHIP